MEARTGGRAIGASCQRGGKNDGSLVPRSSSPVNVYVELPCITEQAFSTIAWGDFRGGDTGQKRHSLDSQVNESDPDEQYLEDFGLDFIADSSLSPPELVPFQGCVIPPLTPQRHFSAEDSLNSSSTCGSDLNVHDEPSWRVTAEHHQKDLERSITINKELHETLQERHLQLDSLQERNLHLHQLASRAKHLASVLENIMICRGPSVGDLALLRDESTSLSPCKRQRLDEGYETESSDSVEDMLRDVSTRCNAMLDGAARKQEGIRVHGSFSGLRVCALKDDTLDRDSSFRTSVGEHGTIRTQAFLHGHAFTSRTQQGGYLFRWVPKHS